MKLEVGMYVRTKNKIIKINQIIENGIRVFEDDYGREFEEETGKRVIRYIDKDGWNCGLDEDEILKASHNIIDLIEVGDYVNGLLVIRILEDIETKEKYINLYGSLSEWEEEDIKSIVTKQQFESMKYEVKEDE